MYHRMFLYTCQGGGWYLKRCFDTESILKIQGGMLWKKSVHKLSDTHLTALANLSQYVNASSPVNCLPYNRTSCSLALSTHASCRGST